MAGIALPFKFNEFGRVDIASSEDRYWKNQILLTLMTKFGERIMRPSFGSNVGDTLFEADELAIETATQAINIAFNTWLPRLVLREVIPVFDYETGYLEISVAYELPSGKSDTITLNTAILNRTGDILEEIPSGQ